MCRWRVSEPPLAIIIALLGFVVLIYAIFSQYDLKLKGRVVWFSFDFQAKDRKSRARLELKTMGKKPDAVQSLVFHDSDRDNS
jgi:hypothetical protein